MASPSSSKTASATFDPPAQRGKAHTWLLGRLDSLLSEELRRGAPSELARSRVLAGGSCILFLFALVGLAAFPSLALRFVMVLIALGYASVLVLLRRMSNHTLPAIVLCSASIVGGSALVFVMRESAPYIGTHAGLMLQPALAVYLLGQRRGFFVALFWTCAALLFPIYYLRFGAGAHSAPDEMLWPLYLCATFSFIAAWGVGSLHSSARVEAERTLERALKELRDSEDQLLSLIESTDDLVVSLDPQGNLLTTNSAARRTYFARFGREPTVGEPYFPASDSDMQEVWAPRLAKALAGQRLRYEETFDAVGGVDTFDISVNPVHGTEGRITGVTVFARNITARKEAELRLGEMYRALVDVSRQAGMAEIATGVLHNVGNTLNSVNVSTTLVIDQLHKSRISGLVRASALLRERAPELSSFLTQDPQGRMLPAYLEALSDQLQQEHASLLKEMRSLSDSVEHIKSVVSMQQKYARVAGAVEEVAVPQLIDEALRLHAVSFGRLGILFEREYADVPPILIDRHRLLQILVNLLSNARDALIASGAEQKRLSIGIQALPQEGRLLIQVTDNGMGIAPEHLPRMFTQGFTTKKEGHGFGLHISALAALEMKGRLSCSSPGPGQGATFTLELPLTIVKEESSKAS